MTPAPSDTLPSLSPGPPRTPPARHRALSAMMFLQHAGLGVWAPLMPLHVRDLGFSGGELGLLFSTFSVAACVSPWLVGRLADRRAAPQALLACGHVIAAAALWAMSYATSFPAVLILMSIHSLAFAPTLALSNVIALRGLSRRYDEFGGVRLWGTASWVVMGVLIGVWLQRPAWLPGAQHACLADALRAGAVLSALLAVYCCVLPAARQPVSAGRVAWATDSALGLLHDGSFRVLLLATLAASIALPFVYPLCGLFLRSLHFRDEHIAPLLSLGQVGEIAALLLLGWAVRRWGFKTVFLIGLAAWPLRFGIWCGEIEWLVIASLTMHGVCYAGVVILGQMYVDVLTRSDARNTAQALHLFVSSGVGSLIGNLLAGAALDAFTTRSETGVELVNFRAVFAGPALLTLAALLLFWIAFNPARPDASHPAQSRSH